MRPSGPRIAGEIGAIMHEIDPKNKSLILNVRRDKLGEFIASLLGQRRSIEHSFTDKIFVIDLDWIFGLDSIIEQRISAQNEGELVSFSASIFLENGRTTTLASRDALRTYHD